MFFIEVHIPISGKRAVMYLWLDLSILRQNVILIFFWNCSNSVEYLVFHFIYIGWYVFYVQHGMYCPAWYVLSSMVCIVQNGTDFPEWYVFSSMVFSSMVCIVQHGMYCPAWYVFFSMVCIVHFIQYVICLLVWEAIIAIFFFKCEIQSFSHGK